MSIEKQLSLQLARIYCLEKYFNTLEINYQEVVDHFYMKFLDMNQDYDYLKLVIKTYTPLQNIVDWDSRDTRNVQGRLTNQKLFEKEEVSEAMLISNLEILWERIKKERCLKGHEGVISFEYYIEGN